MDKSSEPFVRVRNSIKTKPTNIKLRLSKEDACCICKFLLNGFGYDFSCKFYDKDFIIFLTSVEKTMLR